MTARLVYSLRHPLLAAELDAARSNATLVNAWRLSGGEEVLATSLGPGEGGRLAVALAGEGGEVVRGHWPEGAGARETVEGMVATVDGRRA